MLRFISAALFLAIVATILSPLQPAPAVAKTASSAGVTVTAPKKVASGETFAISVVLPADVRAVEGRLVSRRGSAELVGIAAPGGADALRPVADGDMSWFGVTNLAGGNPNVIELVVVPVRDGQHHFRVVLDVSGDETGKSLGVAGEWRASVKVGAGAADLAAPVAPARRSAAREARPIKDRRADGQIYVRDVDIVSAGWDATRSLASVCGASADDVNRDGCTDVLDIQATDARIEADAATEPGEVAPAAVAAAATYVVTSAADTADANPGNGTCADTLGRCTLRAAIMESEWIIGDNRIEFAIPAPAPVQIQLTSQLPFITSRSGGLEIDAYTQTGARVNTAAFGSNAIPGIELRGRGWDARENAFYITSANNTIRGFATHNTFRGVMLDGADASNNRILGNWFGFTGLGTNGANGEFMIVNNTGSHDNIIGTPALADRNVMGNSVHGMEFYGPGTSSAIVQNNLFCIGPGGGRAPCTTGIDYNFGPKNSLIGGTGPNERNVFGPTSLNGIEISHGWNPAFAPREDNSVTWQINNHRFIGNWVGFKADGHYDPNYRSASSNPGGGDNGQGINVYDGSYDNLVEANYVGSWFMGITTMAPNSQRTTIRGNVIGRSPHGEAAPMSSWGIRMRWATKFNYVIGNTISNAVAGGIGIVEGTVFNVRLSQNVVTDTAGPAISIVSPIVQPPTITAANLTGASGTSSSPGATVELFRASRAAGQVGLPIAYIGSGTVAGNGTWSIPATLTAGDRVTALQWRADENTSLLTANVTVGGTTPPNQPPSASFTSSCNGLTCAFTNTSTDDVGITSSAWNFGDGATSTAMNPSRTYTAAGTYAVTLSVTDAAGASSTTNRQVTVTAPNQPPTANFTSSCSGLTCSFTNSSTDDVGVVSSSWNFGDGATSTATNPSRTYGAGGTYTVTLIVTDGSGATSTATRTVTVTAPNQTITLSAVWRKSSGIHFADLSWSGAVGSQVAIYRNGTLLTTTANDGAYSDRLGRGASGSRTYQVREVAPGTGVSNVATILIQ
jgi:CSLREA domain-containing protein